MCAHDLSVGKRSIVPYGWQERRWYPGTVSASQSRSSTHLAEFQILLVHHSTEQMLNSARESTSPTILMCMCSTRMSHVYDLTPFHPALVHSPQVPLDPVLQRVKHPVDRIPLSFVRWRLRAQQHGETWSTRLLFLPARSRN
jgi:hypothetical protein